MANRRYAPSLAATLFLATAALSPAPSAAQPATPDTASLRRSLAAALGGDFQIVRHELSSGLPERGGTFWLVHARPTRSGDFHLQYRYRWADPVHPNDPLYTHVQHESYVRVGERGCWRRREGKDACLGDTVILPFVLDRYTGHTFTLAYRGPNVPRPLAAEPLPAGLVVDSSVPNPVAAHLRYLGAQTHVMLHRVLGSTTVRNAIFEARAPGRFNLAVSTAYPGRVSSTRSPGSSVPVIVVPRGQPVTVMIENEQVHSVNEVSGFSSHTGSQYLTTPLLLQPGDRISLEYNRHTVRGRDDHPEFRPELPPLITRFPFRLDLANRFNAWIAPYLPRER